MGKRGRWLGWGVLLLWMGCASTQEGREASTGNVETRPRRVDPRGLPDLAVPDSTIRSIQLHRTGDERQLPILSLRSGETLTLSFDLMEGRGRPLSVWFYHANRRWQRDLVSSEYLDGFPNDHLLNYTPSRGTVVPYTHYTYRFPNDNIRFTLSGNFVVRVSEQGREDAVLFERAFFVTEQTTPVEMGLENVLVAGNGFSSVAPLVRFTPPTDIQANVFDYQVCFVQNGDLTRPRCTDRPTLVQQPALQFYLEPEAAFPPQPAAYFVDVSQLRIGGRIEATNLTRTPYRLTLEPDYARFPGNSIDPLLNGQVVIAGAVRDVFDPPVAADYALVGFRFVPIDEQPLSADLYVTGSFNGWRSDTATRLVWVPESRWYEGEVLLKQGQYEYRYLTTDARTRRALTGASPRFENLYTALVYYNDLRVSTDRLIGVQSVVSQ
jgi:hypothetical protein